MSDDNAEFLTLLGSGRQRTMSEAPSRPLPGAEVAAASATRSGDTCQWSVMGDDRFRPTSRTRANLPPGLYRIDEDQHGVFFALTHPAVDSLIRLPDSASDKVIAGIKAFWEAKARFQKRGHVYKRGVLLWGPPGGGKTATVNQMSVDLIESGGMVVWIQAPALAISGLAALRRIEPDRPIIGILEDLDELASRWSEHEILSLLDGENQVENVVFVATTNYPERLDGRMINRPSRFDEVIKIGMPSANARAVYIRSRLSETELPDGELARWVAATKEFSIAHIKELIVAVYCLDRGFDETLKRLQVMALRRPTSVNDGREIGMTARTGD